MKGIGGYFELELNRGVEFHSDAIQLNTGRNALEYILLANSYSKIYLPFFICDILLESLKKRNIAIEFYSINDQLEPIFNFKTLADNSAFLYVNYFGLKDNFVTSIRGKCNNLIIDNSQSFFSKPEPKTDTFYSARKFFGVPDGAYLYTNKKLAVAFETDQSYDRCSHLLIRKDTDAESGYDTFRNNEDKLRGQKIKNMSLLTQSILANINYEKVLNRRIENFDFLDNRLKQHNKFKIGRGSGVPLVYPYWCSDKGLKDRLLQNRIFTATYWDNVKKWCPKESLEYKFTDEIVYLPIDQRLSLNELKFIIKIIKK